MSHEQLTVGHLRRLLADPSIDDDTPVCIESGDPNDGYENPNMDPARRVYTMASDIVPVGMGGTDPQFESTRGVLIVSYVPGPPLMVPCAVCDLMLVPNGDRWEHADGRTYRHIPKPRHAVKPPPWWEHWERLTDEERDAVYRTWAARHPWRDGDGFDWLTQIEVSDPCTWNPDSPLAILLRMAAAGDLYPLAAALAAALEPGRSRGDTAG